MKVIVVFDFPEISDPNSSDATFVIDSLSNDLDIFARDGEYDWYIEDAEAWVCGYYSIVKTFDLSILIRNLVIKAKILKKDTNYASNKDCYWGWFRMAR